MLMLNKDEKKALRVSVIELVILIDYIICTALKFTIGLNNIVYIVMIGILPFILLFVAFYPTMDLFNKIKNLSLQEKFNFVIFFLEVIYYIVALFILNK